MPSSAVALAVLVAGAGGGACIDLRTRRVPNVLTASLAAAGLAGAVAGISGLSIAAALAGCGLGLLLMLPGHLIGGTGAGDVKLFAAAGTLIGPIEIWWAFLYTTLAGGAIAVVVALMRRRLRHTMTGTAAIITTRAANAADLERPLANNRFAYAPAIAVGTLLAAFGS